MIVNGEKFATVNEAKHLFATFSQHPSGITITSILHYNNRGIFTNLIIIIPHHLFVNHALVRGVCRHKFMAFRFSDNERIYKQLDDI